MSDFDWKYLTDFSDSTLGLKQDKGYGKQWINEIIERLNAIEDDFEAIYTMFAIQQKIGMAKSNYNSYSSFGSKYPKELYQKLETSLRILLRERLKKQGS